MPQRLSSILKVSSKKLESKGVFNAFVDIDSKLYIDPSLLKSVTIPEFATSHEEFRNYFEKIIHILKKSKIKGDLFWRNARSRLKFKEFEAVALGYSVGSKKGNAIGNTIANNLTITANEIIKAGIDDPVIFELIGLFEEGVGADRISDITVNVIKNDLIAYTQRVCKELNINLRLFGRSKMQLPFNPITGDPIVFTPKELLQDIPIAFSWEDIDRVCQENAELRNRVNKVIGGTWKYATSKVSKKVLRRTLIENPEALKDLIKQYNQKPKQSYNFAADKSGQVIWAELAEKAVNEYPLNLAKFAHVSSKNILKIVLTICSQYEKLIENNGWYEFLYDNTGKLRNERFAQKLFYGIADQYCLANDLNLSREPNAGSGALDFKVTKGYSAVVTVEIKYSSNTSLVRGFTTQLPIYNKAEGASESVYVILRTTHSEYSINRIKGLINKANDEEKKVPYLMVIDARPKKSASRRGK